MIAHLRGIVHRLKEEEVSIDVGGIGYRVYVPITVWDELKDEKESELKISTYVREERLDLFGFLTENDRILFERFIALNGIGPRHALELSAVPKSLLMQAIGSQEPKLLTTIKGIGKKTAEKLLVDLKALAEKQPEIFEAENGKWKMENVKHDQDAIDALKNLGYDNTTILNAIKDLPSELETTEERVAAALRSL